MCRCLQNVCIFVMRNLVRYNCIHLYLHYKIYLVSHYSATCFSAALKKKYIKKRSGVGTFVKNTILSLVKFRDSHISQGFFVGLYF